MRHLDIPDANLRTTPGTLHRVQTAPTSRPPNRLTIRKVPELAAVSDATEALRRLPPGEVRKDAKVHRGADGRIDQATVIERGPLALYGQAAQVLSRYQPRNDLEFCAALAVGLDLVRAMEPHDPRVASNELPLRQALARLGANPGV
jgi:hypothetical protein